MENSSEEWKDQCKQNLVYIRQKVEAQACELNYMEDLLKADLQKQVNEFAQRLAETEKANNAKIQDYKARLKVRLENDKVELKNETLKKHREEFNRLETDFQNSLKTCLADRETKLQVIIQKDQQYEDLLEKFYDIEVRANEEQLQAEPEDLKQLRKRFNDITKYQQNFLKMWATNAKNINKQKSQSSERLLAVYKAYDEAKNEILQYEEELHQYEQCFASYSAGLNSNPS